MLTLHDILGRRETVLKVAAEHGARNVRLFGSLVRGEQTGTSDVDMLVTMDEDRSLLDRIGLIQDLEDLLDTNVDVVNERALHGAIRERVIEEGVPL